MLKAHAEALRAADPRLSFARSWTLATQQHPELAETFAGEETAAHTPVYRFVEKPAYTQPSKPLRELLEDVSPIRIEA